MKVTPVKIINLTVLLFAIIFQFSCSKDSDLLADYVISDTQASLLVANLAIDDYFVIAKDNETILDVLSNDSYEDSNSVSLVKVVQPENGTVIINEDKTLTYIPENLDVFSESTDAQEIETIEENIALEESPGTDENMEETSTDEAAETPQQTGATEESQAPAEETSPKENQSPAEEEESTTQSFTYVTESVNENQTIETTEATVTVKTISESESNVSSYGVDYYVTTNGSANNNGRTEATAWSIEKAFQNAKAGDVVAVKAGNYGNKQLTQVNSGTKDNPIRFIGYTDTPGDLVSSKGSTFEYGDELDSNKMPLLEDKSSNGEVNGTAFRINGQYVHIMNFQISKYSRGLVSSGPHNSIINIISIDAGNHNPSKNRPKLNYDQYSGVGINVVGDNSTIKNCMVINSGSEAFIISGDKVIHDSNKAYCDTDINPTDYYYLLANANNNTVDNLTSFELSDSDFKGFKSYLKTTGFNFETKTEKALNEAIKIAKEEELDDVINSEYKDLNSALQAYKSNAIDDNKTQLKSLITGDIIKRYFYSEGLYLYYTANNTEIKKALSILNNPSQYAGILR